ncbi:hypothetical protein [Sphingomonas sp.]|jgi:hypothetical protein|uniref:hypothetical protein n=1 Tax=Sphingomonas sp. TaxID=28214 RepID=UPI002E3738EF|nr:hypothetical protein [Sphingomonas sp.]HEX4695288.1 hypothetical protein [Sphingomonas sp.]
MATDEFTPTLEMASAARHGLRLRGKFKRGGTEVGVARAHQLIAREPLEPREVKSMYSYFARHEVDKKMRTHTWGSDEDPSAGYIAWLLWGGDAGKEWAGRKRQILAG